MVTGKPSFDHGQTFDHERTFVYPRTNLRFSTSKPWFVHEQTLSQPSEVEAESLQANVRPRANSCSITGKPSFDHGQTFDHERTFVCSRANIRLSKSKPWFVQEQTSSQPSEVDARSTPPKQEKRQYAQHPFSNLKFFFVGLIDIFINSAKKTRCNTLKIV